MLIQIVFAEQAEGGRYCISQHFDYKGKDKIRNAKYPMTQLVTMMLNGVDTISLYGKHGKILKGKRKDLS